jgi:hypothetical protein
MALTITPYTVPPGSAVSFGFLPAGPYYAAVSAGTVAAGIFVGEGTGVTVSNGLFIPGGGAPVPLPGFTGAAGQPLYAIAAAGTVTAVLMVSRPG